MELSPAPLAPALALRVALALAAAAVVATQGVPLLAWTWQLIPVATLPWLCLLLAVTAIARARAPEPARRWILALASLAAMLCFSPLFTAISIAFFAAAHAVLFSRLANPVKVTFLVAAIVAPMFLAGLHLPPQSRDPLWTLLGGMFVLNYTFRLFALYQAARVGKFQRLPLLDCFLYLGLAPYFVIVPYMLAIPRFDRFTRSIGRWTPELVETGARNIAAGVCIATAYTVINSAFPVEQIMIRGGVEGRALAVLPLALLDYPVWAVFSIIGPALVLTGMQQILGVDVTPPFDRPLRSRSVLDWWRRYNTHFRELLVDMFFYPVVMRLRRRPYLAIWLATFAVFMIGSFLFHVPKAAFKYGLKPDWGLMTENFIFAVLVGVALTLERRRWKPRWRLPLPAAILLTWVIVYVGVRTGTIVGWLLSR